MAIFTLPKSHSSDGSAQQQYKSKVSTLKNHVDSELWLLSLGYFSPAFMALLLRSLKLYLSSCALLFAFKFWGCFHTIYFYNVLCLLLTLPRSSSPPYPPNSPHSPLSSPTPTEIREQGCCRDSSWSMLAIWSYCFIYLIQSSQ